MPIVTLDNAELAHPLADALVEGGIFCVEVTLRTPAGIRAIELLATRGDLLVGAGTVTDAAQVDVVADAGANFAVSPGLGLDVLERARERGLALLPGIATPSELQAAVLHGLNRVKLFPAGVLGGLGLIDALAGPFPDVTFMPSGGVSPTNLANYLAHPAVFSAGCSWIATRADIAAGKFDDIRTLAAVASSTARSSRVPAH
ncbi:MAG: keto-deoxy-phosphogluconate aldolase [Glaciihabitans sp.]|nr:keto-deoxy-phosphogluconate aldolase [Glaciihabitans sp.]